MTKVGVLFTGLWCVFFHLPAIASVGDERSIWIQVQDPVEVAERRAPSARVMASVQLASISPSRELPFAHRLTITGIELHSLFFDTGFEYRVSGLAGLSPVTADGHSQFREPLSTQSRFFALEAGLQSSFRFLNQVRLVPGLLVRSQIITQYVVGTQLRTQESIQSYPVALLALNADVWSSGGVEVALTHDLFFTEQMRLGVFYQW